jgi:hypothetical protein
MELRYTQPTAASREGRMKLRLFLAERIERINLSFDVNVITTAPIIKGIENRASQDRGPDSSLNASQKEADQENRRSQAEAEASYYPGADDHNSWGKIPLSGRSADHRGASEVQAGQVTASEAPPSYDLSFCLPVRSVYAYIRLRECANLSYAL